MGRVYLIHFERPIGNPEKRHGTAQHYIGYASKSLKRRLAEHQSGQGARIMAAVQALGISWKVVRTWQGNRGTERQLKNLKSAPRLCPICREQRKQGDQS